MGSSLKHGSLADETPRFQPYQIVCLEYETSYLYAEVVQIIESRQTCWVRPLLLLAQTTASLTENDDLGAQPNCYDLREDSDLLLPLPLFRAALDTEVLSWLAEFYADDCSTASPSSDRDRAHLAFRDFVQQVWQAHPELFQSTSGISKA